VEGFFAVAFLFKEEGNRKKALHYCNRALEALPKDATSLHLRNELTGEARDSSKDLSFESLTAFHQIFNPPETSPDLFVEEDPPSKSACLTVLASCSKKGGDIVDQMTSELYCCRGLLLETHHECVVLNPGKNFLKELYRSGKRAEEISQVFVTHDDPSYFYDLLALLRLQQKQSAHPSHYYLHTRSYQMLLPYFRPEELHHLHPLEEKLTSLSPHTAFLPHILKDQSGATLEFRLTSPTKTFTFTYHSGVLEKPLHKLFDKSDLLYLSMSEGLTWSGVETFLNHSGCETLLLGEIEPCSDNCKLKVLQQKHSNKSLYLAESGLTWTFHEPTPKGDKIRHTSLT